MQITTKESRQHKQLKIIQRQSRRIKLNDEDSDQAPKQPTSRISSDGSLERQSEDDEHKL